MIAFLPPSVVSALWSVNESVMRREESQIYLHELSVDRSSFSLTERKQNLFSTNIASRSDDRLMSSCPSS